MKFLKILLALLILTSVLPALANDDAQQTPEPDYSGNWTVLLSNSLGRHQITFQVEQKDGRLRGYLLAKGQPDLDLDGRLEKDNKVVLWGRYVDRTGVSTEYQFKGKIEGEPGHETMTGKGEYWGKRYEFTGRRD